MARTKADLLRPSRRWRGPLLRAPPPTRPRRRINGKTAVRDLVFTRTPDAPAVHPAPHAQAPVPAHDAPVPGYPYVRGLLPRTPFFLQRYYDRRNERKRRGNASSSSGVQGPGQVVVPLDAEPSTLVDVKEEDDEASDVPGP